MAVTRLSLKTYSDVAYVEGVYRHDPVMERALHYHCKRYFDENYKSVFFIDEESKEDIFQEAFIKLWENIEERRLYVEDGELMGRNGMPFRGALTTYLMGIAKLKYKEWYRENLRVVSVEDEILLYKAKDIEEYKELLYDDGDNAMLTIVADCISHMSDRCRQILTMFYYEEMSLDTIMNYVPEFESKNALKTRKYKCMEELRRSAKSIYHRYLNA